MSSSTAQTTAASRPSRCATRRTGFPVVQPGEPVRSENAPSRSWTIVGMNRWLSRQVESPATGLDPEPDVVSEGRTIRSGSPILESEEDLRGTTRSFTGIGHVDRGRFEASPSESSDQLIIEASRSLGSGMSASSTGRWGGGAPHSGRCPGHRLSSHQDAAPPECFQEVRWRHMRERCASGTVRWPPRSGSRRWASSSLSVFASPGSSVRSSRVHRVAAVTSMQACDLANVLVASAWTPPRGGGRFRSRRHEERTCGRMTSAMHRPIRTHDIGACPSISPLVLVGRDSEY